jgi:hypothetical protein
LCAAHVCGGKRWNRCTAAKVDPATGKRGVAIVPLKVVQFAAVTLNALALVPGGAHAFVLLNKIDLGAEQYFIVQNIYRGWALLGIVLLGALLANLVLAVMLLRRGGAAFALASLAFCCIAVTLVVFFVWTYPSNQATGNWTTIPDNWEQLRRQWEYSHAVNAVIPFVALCSVTLSVLTART